MSVSPDVRKKLSRLVFLLAGALVVLPFAIGGYALLGGSGSGRVLPYATLAAIAVEGALVYLLYLLGA